jgi:hypothetical protein
MHDNDNAGSQTANGALKSIASSLLQGLHLFIASRLTKFR